MAKRTDPSPPSCGDRAASRRPPDLARNLLRKRRSSRQGRTASSVGWLAGHLRVESIPKRCDGQAHGIGSRLGRTKADTPLGAPARRAGGSARARRRRTRKAGPPRGDPNPGWRRRRAGQG